MTLATPPSITLYLLDIIVKVTANCPQTLTLISQCFEHCLVTQTSERDCASGIGVSINVSKNSAEITSAFRNAYDVPICDILYETEKTIEIALQLERSDLLFLHAACFEKGGKATLFLGQPGAGKSTLSLHLVEAGFSYLSDELAPIDPTNLAVWPYQKKIWLKATTHIDTQRLHLQPVHDNLAMVHHAITGATRPTPVERIILLNHAGNAQSSKAYFVAQILSNSLNTAAHKDYGLKIAQDLASNCDYLTLNQRPYQNCNNWPWAMKP